MPSSTTGRKVTLLGVSIACAASRSLETLARQCMVQQMCLSAFCYAGGQALRDGFVALGQLLQESNSTMCLARGLVEWYLHGVDGLQIRVARARAYRHDGAQRQRQRLRPAPLQRTA